VARRGARLGAARRDADEPLQINGFARFSRRRARVSRGVDLLPFDRQKYNAKRGYTYGRSRQRLNAFTA
jgi:hypothetical protein